MLLLLASLLSLLALGHCENLTVTDEVFLDFEIRDLFGEDEHYTGRVVIGLFGELLPVTTTNFKAFARGHRHREDFWHYKDTPVHRIVRDFVIQMGDVTEGTGEGGLSIYGEKFRDENFSLSHRSPGWVSMANSGPNTNKSQFFITLIRARWLDGRHVAFGRVLKGMDTVRKIADVPVDRASGKSQHKVMIADSGVLNVQKKYELSDEQLSVDGDVITE